MNLLGKLLIEPSKAGKMDLKKQNPAGPRRGPSPETAPGWARARIYAAMALSAGVGSVSLAALGLFLLAGPLRPWDLGFGPAGRLAWDSLLCAMFFAVHSGLIRLSFRDRLGALVRRELQPALYSFLSGLFLLFLVLLWQPAGPAVHLTGAPRFICRLAFGLALAGFAWTGWALNDLDALGLKALRGYLKGRPKRPGRMTIRGPYRWVRHPFYLFTLLMIWSHPDLSADRLLFNLLFTAWIILGTFWEEKDLARSFGGDYLRYRKLVPRLIPVRLKPVRWREIGGTGRNQ